MKPAVLGTWWTLLLCAGPAQAQGVRGELLDTRSGLPISREFVVLLDTAGTEVARALTDAHGHFELTAPAPGRYRLRFRLIGYRPAISEFLDLDPGTRHEERLETAPLQRTLDPIFVEGSAHCRTRDEAGAAARALWEAAHDALAGVVWTEGQLHRYEVELFTRLLSRGANRVRREHTARQSGLQAAAFLSAPARQLVDSGFIVAHGDSAVFYGPDAQVLLSDAFAGAYCFAVRSGTRSRQGRLALMFRPSGRSSVSTIEGELWIDPAGAGLERLEFRYQPVGRLPGGSGFVDFARLSSGAWIVESWTIRMEERRGRRLTGYREIGGRVTSVRAMNGETLY